MKKTILVLLMAVMIATPCFAQDIEPQGLFSIEGTAWQALPIELQIFPFPWIYYTDALQLGFYGDQIYLIPSRPYFYIADPFYIDMLVCSIFSGVYWNDTMGWTGSPNHLSGIMFPIGVGMVFQLWFTDQAIPLPVLRIALLIKTDDNWTPPELE